MRRKRISVKAQDRPDPKIPSDEVRVFKDKQGKEESA